jgi:hypothetical protein
MHGATFSTGSLFDIHALPRIARTRRLRG